MDFKNLVRASAQIIQITQLQKGDTFKMITEWYSSPELSYGIVTDIMNDWDKGFVSAIIMKPWYYKIEKEVKLLSPVNMEKSAIFPCSWEDIKIAFQDTVASAERAIKEAEEKLIKDKENLEFGKSILSGQYAPITQMPTFELIDSPIS